MYIYFLGRLSAFETTDGEGKDTQSLHIIRDPIRKLRNIYFNNDNPSITAMRYLCAVPTVRYITKSTHRIPYSTWEGETERNPECSRNAGRVENIYYRTCGLDS